MKLSIDRLEEFLDHLRRDCGFRLGIGDFAAIESLMLKLAAEGRLPNTREEIRTLISPVICRSPQEQREFYAELERWPLDLWEEAAPTLGRATDAAAPPQSQMPSPGRRAPRERAARLRRWSILVIAGAMAVMIAAVGWSLREQVSSALPPDYPPAVRPDVIEPQRIGLTLVPWLPFLLWLAWRGSRRAELKRSYVSRQPATRTLYLSDQLSKSATDNELRGAVRTLRRHREVVSTDLDLPSTIAATIEAFGLITPVYGSRALSPEYLLLVDKSGPRDLLAALGERLSWLLDEEHVHVVRYEFYRDPRLCFFPAGGSRAPVSIQELQARHPEHRLLILSEAMAFFDPFTGFPQHWMQTLTAWSFRCLLTPVPRAAWGGYESALQEQGFTLANATSTDLAALAARLQTAEPEPPARLPAPEKSGAARPLPRLVRQRFLYWLQPIPPEPELQERLLKSLRDYLGERTFRWMAACAVFPGIYPALTLFLGARWVKSRYTSTPEWDEEGALRLAQLPWFRQGTMPDWLRLSLIQELPNTQLKEVRNTLAEFLMHPRRELRSGTKLEIATDNGLRERLHAVLARARKEPRDSTLREQIFLRFMIGWRPGPLSVAVPRPLQRLLSDAPGPATLGSFGFAFIASVLLWFLYEPLGFQSIVGTAGTEFSDVLRWLIPVGIPFSLGMAVLWVKLREPVVAPAAERARWPQRLIRTAAELWAHWDLALMSLSFALYLLVSLWQIGLDLRRWDMLLISGLTSFLFAIWLTRRLPERMAVALEALVANGALFATPSQLQGFRSMLETRSRRWAQGGGLFIAVVIALAFLGAHGSRIVDHLPLLSIEAFAGFIAGMQLGRMASYGQLAQLLKREEIVWRVVPGHANGAGGLKPIGNFYLYQAGILGLAAAFLAIWWAIIPWWPQYAEWRTPYLALLGVVMLLAILIFAVPIFSFHREMHRQKQSRQGEADDMERAMEDMRAQLAGETDADARQSIEQRLAYMNERRRAIRQMPTWPL